MGGGKLLMDADLRGVKTFPADDWSSLGRQSDPKVGPRSAEGRALRRSWLKVDQARVFKNGLLLRQVLGIE